MIASEDIRQAYQDLYVCMRNYIWAFSIVESLADLEVAAFQAVPNLEDVKYKLRVLRMQVNGVDKKDEDFCKAFDAFEELLNSGEQVCSRLNAVREERGPSENL